MPMVPMFQGGVPQVGDSAASGGMVVHAPQARMDYGRVVQEATKPLEAFAARNYDLALRERSREVKAESDDAEVQVMQAIQQRLYAPETGYMNLQGKNASQGYESSFQGMKKDVDDIVGRLSPQAREAVESRVADRLTAVQGQMMRWNSQQTRQWHFTSSQSRLDALLDDAAQHYGDEIYRSKSWLSAVGELKYQANLVGMDEATTAQKTAALYDLFQTKRFDAWAQDDPVTAFQTAQAEKEHMTADVWGKLDDGLWRQAKPMLALAAAGTLPRNMSKTDLIQAIRGNGVKTGIPAVDELTPVRKAEILTSAYSYVEHDRAKAQTKVELDTKDSLATIRDTGDDPNMLTEDQFIAADPERGKQKYDVYLNEASTAHWLYSLGKMPNSAAEASIEAAKPIPGDPNYAEKSKNWAAMQRAYAQVKKARTEDPVAAAVSSGVYGFQSIEDWTSSKVIAELGHRADLSDRVAQDYGVSTSKILTKPEVESLTKYLETLAPNDQVRWLSSVSNNLSEFQTSIFARQIGDTSGLALVLTRDVTMPAKTAATFLAGKQAMSAGDTRVAAFSTDKLMGKPAQIARLDGYIAEPEVRKQLMEAVTGIAAGKVLTGAADNMEEAFDAAFVDVLGTEVKYNGGNVFLKDADEYDLRRTVWATSDSFRDKKTNVAQLQSGDVFTGEKLARLLKSAPLVPTGSGANEFNAMVAGQIVYDMDRRPIVIKVEGRK